MALGILGVLAALAILISVVLITALFYQNGRFVENRSVFTLIQAYLIILALLQISAVPANDWLGKALGGGVLAITAAAFVVRRKNFRAARWMLAAMLVAAPFLLYWS